MPLINVNSTEIYYRDSAPEDTSKPVMVFAHGLLYNTEMYAKQIAYFEKDYRCIAFDFRGQGESKIAKSGYDMDTLAEDSIELIKKLNITRCHFIGLSMGGFIGLRLALKYPQFLDSLIVLNSSADAESAENIPQFKRLLTVIKWLSTKVVSNKIAPLMFGYTYLNDKSRKAEYRKWKTRLESNNKKGVILSTTGVIERTSVYDQLDKITTPTLIAVGNEDITTPYVLSERMHFAIAGSKMAVFGEVGHMSTIEAPELVNTTIEHFINQLEHR